LKKNKHINENFGLPDSYFRQSAENILQKIEWQEEHKPYPLLSNQKKQSGFSVPNNYFSANHIILELTDYLKLSAIQNKHSFTLPENYFQHNSAKLAKLKQGKRGTIIPFFSKKVWYAAAALLVIALGVKLFNLINHQTIINEDCNTLACIEKRELINRMENADLDDLMEIVSPEALEKTLIENERTENKNNDSLSSDELLDLME